MIKKLALLIVVHNEKNNLEMLFDSLSKQSFREFKIFFIDNNSKDGSVEFAKELNKNHLFDIEFIELIEDTGYTKGNNIGAQKALNQGYEFLFIINNDIELERNCVEELLVLIESNKNIGAVGPILFYWNKDKIKNIIQLYGLKINYKNQRKTGYFGGLIYEDISPPEMLTVDYPTGTALMIRMEFVKKYGLFDEDLFMYNDEIDLAYRLKNAGYLCYVTNKAKVWHNHNFSKENVSGHKFMYYYIMRNRVLYFKKFKLYPQLLADLFFQIVTFPSKINMFIKMGSISIIKFYYSGLIDGLLGKKGVTLKSFKS